MHLQDGAQGVADQRDAQIPARPPAPVLCLHVSRDADVGAGECDDGTLVSGAWRVNGRASEAGRVGLMEFSLIDFVSFLVLDIGTE